MCFYLEIDFDFIYYYEEASRRKNIILRMNSMR